MKRSVLISSLGALAMGAIAQDKPNVILLVADDLGYGDLSCYGAQRVATPTVDSLAEEGIRLTDMHACASTSTPSRYSLLTGQYPWRKRGTNVAPGDEKLIISKDTYTIADLFKDNGYATAAIGKWHLGLGSKRGTQDWNGKLDVTPKDIGFDYHYLMAATADRVPCVFIEQGEVANYDADAPIYVSYRKNFKGEPTGRKNPELLTKLHPSHGHDMAIVNGISRIGFMKGGGKALWRDEDIADSIAAHANRFMAAHKSEPFFMYLCTNDVHVPRYPHERFRGKSPMGLRGEAILQFDWTVKQVVNELERLGIADNTIIMITSDNGPVLDDGYKDLAWHLAGSHNPSGPFRGGKYSSYEGGTAVPFIVHYPKKWKKHTVSDVLASHIDLPRSMAHLLKAEVPAGAFPDSENHLNTLKGRHRDGREYVFTMPINRSVDVRSEKWKYIPSTKGPNEAWQTHIETGFNQPAQLYDFAVFRYEGKNVAAEHPKVVERMQKALDEMMAKQKPMKKRQK